MAAQPPSVPAPVRQIHKSDPERRRATYDVDYPLVPMVFTTRHDFDLLPKANIDDKRTTVASRRLTFALPYGTAPAILFKECNFHDRQGKGVSEIAKITFRDCVFERSMMGTTRYHRVRFEQCHFSNVDFDHAEFAECTFDGCSFFRCTTEHAFFSRTQISAQAFIAGLECPVYNYGAFDQSQRAALSKDWNKVRARIAASVSAGCEGVSSQVADEALHVARLEDWRMRAFESRIAWLIAAPRGLIIWVTKGGTSLGRSVALIVAVTLLAPAMLRALDCTYDKAPLTIGSASDYAMWALRANGLVLAYAPDRFGATNLLGEFALAAVPSLGIMWIAVLLAVLVRRVYR